MKIAKNCLGATTYAKGSGGVFLLIIAHSSIHCSCTPTWCFSASVCATTSAGRATMAIYS